MAESWKPPKIHLFRKRNGISSNRQIFLLHYNRIGSKYLHLLHYEHLILKNKIKNARKVYQPR